jgi:ASC-1-like (ASCH) protein
METEVKTYSMRLNPEWFSLVRDGVKTFEGRAIKCEYKLGEVIEFTDMDRKESFTTVISSIHIFPSFRKALEVLGLEKTLPGIETIEEGVNVYRKYVSLETQERLGVYMLGLERYTL